VHVSHSRGISVKGFVLTQPVRPGHVVEYVQSYGFVIDICGVDDAVVDDIACCLDV